MDLDPKPVGLRPGGSTPQQPGRAASGAGVSVLDLTALIMGSAVAAVHLRAPVGESSSARPGFLFWLAFAGVGLTASGPLVYFVRRLKGKLADYPRWGDRLWLILGLPWLLTAPLGSLARSDPARASLYQPAVVVGVGIACLAVLLIVWKNWVKTQVVDPDAAPARWTERVGMTLAVAWPLQCGFAMILLSP